MADEEDEEEFGGLYEDGHWTWDNNTQGLVFISHLPPKPVEAVTISLKAPTGTIEFRDDIDLLEQMRFRRRYQRKIKAEQPEVITLQDVKDIALFTAPVNILSPMLINLLHQTTTERFIRALLFYCQYYLQIVDEMTNRVIELETKVRTPDCSIKENDFSIDLSDIRLLIAKEYCTMLIGGSDTKKFHHMGPLKKRKSLSNKDAHLFETFIRFCVQIIWLALGRKSFNQIELEVNRIFKTEIFNAVEHNLKTGYISKMTPEERSVLLGHCVRHDKKLVTSSPLCNEMFCHRPIDYRLTGLGVIKYLHMTPRLLYMYYAVAGPEESLTELGVTVGILGMPRNFFDTMLRPLPSSPIGESKSKSRASVSASSASRSSASGMRKSQMSVMKLYPDIQLPQQDTSQYRLPSEFPSQSEPIRPCSETQRKRWLNRLKRLLHQR